MVVSSHAKNKIRSYFRKADKEENIIKGKELLEREIKNAKLEYNDIINSKYQEFILKRFNLNAWEDLYSAIGYGGIKPGYMIQRVKEHFKEDFPEPEVMPVFSTPKEANKGKAVKIQGHNDLATKFARCCMPVPGDKIIGYITRGRGVSIHRADCINIKNTIDTDRLIEVDWMQERANHERFSTEIIIKAADRKGLVSDISTIISNEGVSITGLTVKTHKDGTAYMSMNVFIKDTKQVDQILGKVSVIPGITSVYRI